jgi:hypothetical protein
MDKFEHLSSWISRSNQSFTLEHSSNSINTCTYFIWGHAVAELVEALRYKPESRGIDSRWCDWDFSLTQSVRPHCGHGVDSASNRNNPSVSGAHSPYFCTSVSNAGTFLAVFHHMFMSSLRIPQHISHLSGISEMELSHSPFMIFKPFVVWFHATYVEGSTVGGLNI